MALSVIPKNPINTAAMPGSFSDLLNQERRSNVATPTASGGTAMAVATIPIESGLPAAMSPPPKRNAVLLNGPPTSSATIASSSAPKNRVEVPCMPESATVRLSNSDAIGAPMR